MRQSHLISNDGGILLAVKKTISTFPSGHLAKKAPGKYNAFYVAEVLSESRTFYIPRYQRAYAWGETQISEFIEDIEFAIQTKSYHSFGSIEARVIGNFEWAPDGKVSGDFDVLEVSDGQQRLTTFLLTWSAIAHYEKSKGKSTSLKELLKWYFRTGSGKVNGGIITDIFALNLQENELQNALSGILRDGPKYTAATTMSAERRLIEAFNTIYSCITYLNSDEYGDFVEYFYSKSESVLIISDANPHIKFEVRNNRGYDVSELDKVKNFIDMLETNPESIVKGDFPSVWFDSICDLDNHYLNRASDEKELLVHSLTCALGWIEWGDKYNKFREEFKPLNTIKLPPKPSKILRELDRDLHKFKMAFTYMAFGMCEIFERGAVDDSPLAARFESLQLVSPTSKEQASWIDDYGHALGLLSDITLRLDRGAIFSTLILATYCNLQDKVQTDEEKKKKTNNILRWKAFKEFITILSYIERTLFRVYHVRGKTTAHGKSNIAEIAKIVFDQIFDNSNLKNKEGDLAKLILDKLCDFVLVETDSCSLTELYQTIKDDQKGYTRPWSRYFLFHWEVRLQTDMLLTSGSEAKSWIKSEGNGEYFAKEHIMPISGWKKNIEDDKEIYWDVGDRVGFHPIEGDNPNERELMFTKYLNRLGNLVMAKQAANSAYDNNPYRRYATGDRGKEKWKMYQDPSIDDWWAVEEVAFDYKEWSLDAIKERQERMARWAVKRWQLPCDCDKPPSKLVMPEYKGFISEHSEEFIQRKKFELENEEICRFNTQKRSALKHNAWEESEKKDIGKKQVKVERKRQKIMPTISSKLSGYNFPEDFYTDDEELLKHKDIIPEEEEQ